MQNRKPDFENADELIGYLNAEHKSRFVAEMLCEDYPGMVLFVGLDRNRQDGTYLLNLEWMSYGLDYSGENWQQSYQYGSDTLPPLLAYL